MRSRFEPIEPTLNDEIPRGSSHGLESNKLTMAGNESSQPAKEFTRVNTQWDAISGEGSFSCSYSAPRCCSPASRCSCRSQSSCFSQHRDSHTPALSCSYPAFRCCRRSVNENPAIQHAMARSISISRRSFSPHQLSAGHSRVGLDWTARNLGSYAYRIKFEGCLQSHKLL